MINLSIEQSPRSLYQFIFEQAKDRGTAIRRITKSQELYKLKLKKIIVNGFEQRPLIIEMLVNKQYQVSQLKCQGLGWSTLMLSVSIIGSKYTLYLKDIMESLEYINSIDDLVQIYQTQNQLQPKL